MLSSIDTLCGLWHKFAQLRGMPQLRHAMPTLGPSWPLARKTKFEVGPGDPKVRVEVTRGSCRS